MQRRLPSFLRASSVLLWGLLPACTGRHADSGHPADDTAADTASPTDSGSPDGGGADGGGADGGGDTAADSGDTGTPFDPTICSVGIVSDDPDIGVQAIDVALPDADGAFSVHGVVRWPAELPIKGVLRPMVMVVQGGWDAVTTPIDRSTGRPDVRSGLTALHIDLPGGGESTGDDDRRGAGSRAAVAAAMRYAAGLSRDQDGCRITDRAPGTDPSDLYLLGLSNGGNLALATLADASLDVPDLHGLVLWETPSAPQFATVELGVDPTVYEPGSCALTAAGIECAFDDATLYADGSHWCFDVDLDHVCDRDDIPLVGIDDPVSGLRMLSPELRAVLPPSSSGFASLEDTRLWWQERDGGALAAAMVARWPTLPVMLLGTEEDHVLSTWTDHPNVFGLGEALQRAGVAWLRLNPGMRWLPEAPGENPPNLPLSLADPTGVLVPEDVEQPDDAFWAAGVRELADRHRDDDWAE